MKFNDIKSANNKDMKILKEEIQSIQSLIQAQSPSKKKDNDSLIDVKHPL